MIVLIFLNPVAGLVFWFLFFFITHIKKYFKVLYREIVKLNKLLDITQEKMVVGS